MKVHLRKYRSTDLQTLLHLFYNTVHTVNVNDYTAAQIKAWALPPEEQDHLVWEKRFSDQYTICAVVNNDAGHSEIVGFISLTMEGYLDLMFVSHLHLRKGIARLLMTRVFYEAKNMGLEKIDTDASITGRPFFEKMGFKLIRIYEKEIRGQVFVNNIMEIKMADI